MNPQTLNILKSKLEAESSTLEKELQAIAVEDQVAPGTWNAIPPKEDNPDLEERADETEELQNRRSLEENMATKLNSIKNALEKIKSGTYGTCETCGKEIDEARLMAYPEARFCINDNKNGA